MHQDRAGWWATSALGQKQTFAVHQTMSALPPNSDIDCVFRHVRFGPKADIPVFIRSSVGALLEVKRNVESERLGGLEVDPR
jgi:hypothetical protein